MPRIPGNYHPFFGVLNFALPLSVSYFHPNMTTELAIENSKGSAGYPTAEITVAHVVLSLNMGGMEKLLVEFARHADRKRFNLLFISLTGRGKPALEIEDCGWQVVTLDEPEGFRPTLIVRLARLFRQLKVNIVHTHNSKSLIYAGPAARLARVSRVIHTQHGQRYGARKRETKVFRFAARFVDRLVGVSKDSAEISVKDGIPAQKVITILNGIDLQKFTYLGPEPNGPVVMVGRLSPEKDVQNLIQAASIIAQRHPDFRLEIAGNGPCMDSLSAMCSKFNLGQNVRLLGEVGDIPSLLSRASLFVLPSITEGISLTLLEAMARGIPIVATRVGGNPEVIIDEQTGLLVPPQSPEALAAAILRLWRDPETALLFSKRGQERVEALFDSRDMVAQYEALYTQAG